MLDAKTIEVVRNALKWREDKLLAVLNDLINVLDPIKFEDLNVHLIAADQTGLLELEKGCDRLILGELKSSEGTQVRSSVLAIISTITNILVDKRLAVKIDGDTEIVVGFCWAPYSPQKVWRISEEKLDELDKLYEAAHKKSKED